MAAETTSTPAAPAAAAAPVPPPGPEYAVTDAMVSAAFAGLKKRAQTSRELITTLADKAAEKDLFWPEDTKDGEEDPTYEAMLDRLYEKLNEFNPELATRTKKQLKPPEVSSIGSTRTAWTNFQACCEDMGRSLQHVSQFFLAELNTTGDTDGQNRLVLRGRYKPRMFESLMAKYIMEYVKCEMCSSLNTELTRDALTRLYFMSCHVCGSRRSVANIQSFYHAVGRGDRRKERNKAS
ncbi:eif-2beta [Symbiodinium sp. KB8]|nr:eif-2beta [Symbiodinium sp. KB8]